MGMFISLAVVILVGVAVIFTFLKSAASATKTGVDQPNTDSGKNWFGRSVGDPTSVGYGLLGFAAIGTIVALAVVVLLIARLR